MLFTVTYRGDDGASLTDVVEATSRGDCLSQMRARGLTVLCVKEGGKKRAGNKRERRVAKGYAANRKTAPYVLWVVFAVLVGAAVWWWMANSNKVEIPTPQPPVDDNATKKPRGLAKEVKPSAAPKPVENDETRKPKQPITSETATNVIRKYKGVDIVSSTSQTNTDGTVIERIYTADGKSHRVTHLPPPVFKNPCDEYLAAILTVPKNAPMAPLPDLSHEHLEEQFKEAIKTPIEVLPDDPDNVKEAKLLVIAAREEMSALLKNGYKFHEVLMEQQKIAAENLDIRAKVIREFNEIVKSGDRESAQTYVRKMNIALQQMGIDGLKLPASMRTPEGEEQKEEK